MKTTTRLYDIIYSTYNKLYSDFIDNHQITYFNPEFQFSHKVVDYDDEIKTVCRNTIFYGLDFLDETPRQRFEQEFLSRFLSRTIKFQTYELFNWKLTAYLRGIKEIITDYYINIEKYIQAYSSSTTSGNSKSQGETLTRDNNLEVTLPQDNTDLSLDKDSYDYADTTAHSKSRSSDASSQNTSQESNAISYDVTRLTELQAFHDNLFNELDRMLFSQIFRRLYMDNETNINKVDFDENKPYLAPHNPFTLEGHWQPWYDDRRDYNTNAPTYFDYLSNFNHLIKSIVDLLNRVARRNIKVEDTPCIDMTKIHDWIDEGNECHTYHDVITLKADVILSTYQKILQFDGKQYSLNNAIACLPTGLYASDYLPILEALKDKLNKEIGDRIEGDKELNKKIEQVKNELQQAIDNLRQEFNNYKQVNNAEISKLKQEISQLKTALQKIVTNLYEGGNATSNDINNFNINNHIAAGNINLYGGTPDGQTLIRTHNGQAENDLAGGV